MGEVHLNFRITGLCVEVFKSYFKLTIDVIPIGLQMHTICNWLTTVPMVNLLLIVSPKMDWCPDSPLKSSVSQSLGRNALHLLFLLILPIYRTKGFRKAFCECTARKIYSFSLYLTPLALFSIFFFSFSYF